MDRTLSYFLIGREEGILIILHKLGKKEGILDKYITKEYVIQKLTELELTEYIEPITQEYFSK